jgi:hypothetical protein
LANTKKIKMTHMDGKTIPAQQFWLFVGSKIGNQKTQRALFSYNREVESAQRVTGLEQTKVDGKNRTVG